MGRPKESYSEQALWTLSLNLYAARTARGFSAGDVAALADLSRSTVVAIERREQNPTLITIAQLAYALDMTMEQLLAGG